MKFTRSFRKQPTVIWFGTHWLVLVSTRLFFLAANSSLMNLLLNTSQSLPLHLPKGLPPEPMSRFSPPCAKAEFVASCVAVVVFPGHKSPTFGNTVEYARRAMMPLPAWAGQSHAKC